jgi:hypothetical protein
MFLLKSGEEIELNVFNLFEESILRSASHATGGTVSLFFPSNKRFLYFTCKANNAARQLHIPVNPTFSGN